MRLFTMAATVLRNLVTKPATRLYPFVKRAAYKNTRGRIAINISKCIFCGMCQRRCPTGAITVTKAEKKWAINRLRCTACACCVEVCPVKCLAMESQYTEPVLEGKAEDVFNA